MIKIKFRTEKCLLCSDESCFLCADAKYSPKDFFLRLVPGYFWGNIKDVNVTELLW